MTGRTFCSPLCCAYGKNFAVCGKAQHTVAVGAGCAAEQRFTEKTQTKCKEYTISVYNAIML